MQTTQSRTQASAPPRWVLIRDHLGRNILGGRMRQGTVLPSISSLMRIHGADYRTVKRALESLRQQGRIEPYGRGYRVSLITASRSNAVVSLVLDINSPGMLPSLSSRGESLLRSIETEAVRRNCRLRIISPGQISPIAKTSSAAEKTFGFIVLERSLPHALSSSFIPRLLKQAYPVAFIDESATYSIKPAMHCNPLFRRFLVGPGRRCGLDMGRHLITKGYRRIAVFAQSTKAIWCRNRIRGIIEAYSEADLQSGVTVFSLSTFDSPAALTQEIYRDRHFAELLSSFERIKSISPVEWMTANSTYVSIMFRLLAREVQFRQLRPHLETAIDATPPYACWVCTTDSAAIIAHDFLAARPRGNIALCGFDDSLEACAANITSYNFNIPAAVQGVFDHLMTTRKGSREHGYNTVEVPGYVVPRVSA